MLTIKEVMCLLGIILAILILTAEPSQAYDQRVGIMPFSKHFNDRSDYAYDDDNEDEGWNETHNGVFYELDVTGDDAWGGVMVYENSINRTSVTVYGLAETAFTQGSFIDAGLMFGAVTGYDRLPVVPYLLPIITIKANEHIKARTIVFPLGVATQFVLEF